MKTYLLILNHKTHANATESDTRRIPFVLQTSSS